MNRDSDDKKIKDKPSLPRRNKKCDSKKTGNFPIVAIGASAGGLDAITEFLRALSSDTGMAFIYVQHLSPDHDSILSVLLAKTTKMTVLEAGDKSKMKPNTVYVIPPAVEMNILNGQIRLTPRPDKPAFNFPIDILFSSLAEKHRANVIGIILSGTATDGTRGLRAIKNQGGLTFAQDDSAKFGSMPRSAIAEGVVDFVLSPKEIAMEINRICKHPLLKFHGPQNGERAEIEDSPAAFDNIMQYVREQVGVDFTLYKMNTIKRRIQRRMVLNEARTIKDYTALLVSKKEEVSQLYDDLLINVTSFFRDDEACQYLKVTLLPKLLRAKSQKETLRIWVPACSTGEEAYSIAMMIREFQEGRANNINVQIFASDLSTRAISKARTGIYTQQEVEKVSTRRLQRFFTKSNGDFRIKQSIRDLCIFAPHNILNDPPFSRIDFISCCNLLIYFDTVAQHNTMLTFHFALKDDGLLMLGKSESIGSSNKYFTEANKKFKLFVRKKRTGGRVLPGVARKSYAATRNRINELPPQVSTIRAPAQNNGNYLTGSTDFDNVINSILLSDHVPASIVINRQMDILQFRGSTSAFLEHTPGKANLNVLKMAKPEIAFEIRNAISRAFKTKKSVTRKDIEVSGGKAVVTIEAVPFTVEGNESLLLMLFKEQILENGLLTKAPKASNNKESTAKEKKIKKLQEEVASYREELQELVDSHEGAIEELQSANEEVVSSNEELRSINEELETSKEEIQSANEELATTNQELQIRNELLNEAYNYSEAIISTVHDPMVVLDKNLRVKSANKNFYRKFQVSESATEGKRLYDLDSGQWNIPKLRDLLEHIIPRDTSFEGFEVENEFPPLGRKTMLLNAHRIVRPQHREQLILLAIADITERKQAEELIRRNENALKQTARKMEDFIKMAGHELKTPITTLKGHLQLTLNSVMNNVGSSPLLASSLKIMEKQLEKVVRLVDELLDVSKIESELLVMENQGFNLNAVVSETINELLYIHPARIILIEQEGQYEVLGDRDRIGQVATNLLINAIKYSPSNTQIDVRIGRHGHNNVSVNVCDRGIGIGESEQEKIFEKFYRTEGKSQENYPGFGLGLYIASQIVKWHKGTLSVVSEKGKGSTFTFILPISE